MTSVVMARKSIRQEENVAMPQLALPVAAKRFHRPTLFMTKAALPCEHFHRGLQNEVISATEADKSWKNSHKIEVFSSMMDQLQKFVPQESLKWKCDPLS